MTYAELYKSKYSNFVYAHGKSALELEVESSKLNRLSCSSVMSIRTERNVGLMASC